MDHNRSVRNRVHYTIQLYRYVRYGYNEVLAKSDRQGRLMTETTIRSSGSVIKLRDRISFVHSFKSINRYSGAMDLSFINDWGGNPTMEKVQPAATTLSSALQKKIKLSIGLVARTPGAVGFKSDLSRDNQGAASRRALNTFEARLLDLKKSQPAAAGDSDDSDNEDLEKDSRAAFADLSWSAQAEELDILANNKRTRQYGRLEYILPFLKTVTLKQCGIQELDKGISALKNLSELNVSGNEILRLENLPETLVSLHAYDNQIASLQLSNPVLHKLVHLGLGYNNISHVGSWVEHLTSLQSLDLCHNNISDLDATIDSLTNLDALEHLHLEGNLVASEHGYRRSVIESLPDLVTLDGLSVDELGESDEEEPQSIEDGCEDNDEEN